MTDKPIKGQPCNGCGVCCKAERCGISIAMVGDGPGPCPLLTEHDGRHWCGAVETEREAGMEPVIANVLGIGRGCDSDDEGE